MTYIHDKNPWKIAHNIEWFCDHDIVIASAEPKLIPAVAMVDVDIL